MTTTTSRVCEADDLEELMDLGRAYAQGDRYVVTESGGTSPQTAHTPLQAVKLRGAMGAKNEEEAWCDGSGGGINLITDEIIVRLTGSGPFNPAEHDRDALRGLALAILAATK